MIAPTPITPSEPQITMMVTGNLIYFLVDMGAIFSLTWICRYNLFLSGLYCGDLQNSLSITSPPYWRTNWDGQGDYCGYVIETPTPTVPTAFKLQSVAGSTSLKLNMFYLSVYRTPLEIDRHSCFCEPIEDLKFLFKWTNKYWWLLDLLIIAF